MITPRKICIVSGTRAEWGLLSPIAHALNSRPDVTLQIVATNMHLLPRFGMTVNQITSEGFTVDARVPMPEAASSSVETVLSMASGMAGMAEAFNTLRPDMILILGDRTEILAAATAANIMRIPIAHLHGGEISEGALDDSIRHAVTKLSSLHLVSTESYRRRVIQLGEDPSLVLNVGAIGVFNVLNQPRVPLNELIDILGFRPDSSTLLVTYHPATLDSESVHVRCSALLDALDRFSDSKIIITYPNNDPGAEQIISLICHYAKARPGRVTLIPSLGMKRYLSLLPLIGAVVGNSSSGIIEVPSMGTPTVDIGIRQKGRIAAPSVIHCGDSTDEIAAAISRALSPEGQSLAKSSQNPYYKPDTLSLIVNALVSTPLDSLSVKSFHDLPCNSTAT